MEKTTRKQRAKKQHPKNKADGEKAKMQNQQMNKLFNYYFIKIKKKERKHIRQILLCGRETKRK
jgi:formylmethanofuran dehydrogenase subunit E